MNKSSCAFCIIQKTIQDSKSQLSIKELCSIAGVSRSGYYAWLKAATVRQQREELDRKDFDLILDAYTKYGADKGARGIYMTLLHHKPPIIMNLKKIRRLTHKYRLFCPIRKANPYRQFMNALKSNRIASNLLNREFEKHGPRKILLTDITYLPYHGTFAYLSTILDAFTKEILAYVLSDSLKEDFVLETVNQLMDKHGIFLHSGTIVHSDQGSHYTCLDFIQILSDKDLRQSMSRRGNCWDNAPQESFFGHMKDHIKSKLKQATEFSRVQKIVDDYMDYYNNDRYQWHLARLSPNEFYKFVTTGKYPLDVPNIPAVPVIEKGENP